MDKILDLLTKWAALEPQHCQRSNGVFWLLFDGIRFSCSLPLEPVELAFLQHALQMAIALHNLMLRIEYSPSERVCQAQLLDSATNTASVGRHEEGAIALLQCYVGWLERKGGQA